MNEIIEKLAYKIGEAVQSSALNGNAISKNVFHRNVSSHESSDISYINGLVSTGLRGSALLKGEKLTTNFSQLLTASRQHLPVVVNTSARSFKDSNFSTTNNYGNISAIQQTGGFQLVASSAQDEVYLTLIAHRIAELSLIPGVVIADYNSENAKAELPTNELIIKYLGDSDDQIECPTPAQEMLFGKTRRRIPNWYSLDVPVMLGARKDGEAISFEKAASDNYFYAHLSELIQRAYSEFNQTFGLSLAPLSKHGEASESALISVGGQISELYDQLTPEGKLAQLVIVNQLSPFPSTAIAEASKGYKGITILENSAGVGEEQSILHIRLKGALTGSSAKIYSGKFSANLNASSLEKAIQNMSSGQGKSNYYLGIDFTKTSSKYPKHEILLKNIDQKYSGLSATSINGEVDSGAKSTPSEVPMAVRVYKDNGPNYSKLSRFYDDTAFFYESNEHNELVADPFSALPLVPGSAASLFNQSSKRELIPVVDVSKCVGDGNNFVHCPHSALLPIVINVEELVNSGIKMAASKGATITKLTPMVKNLAKVAAKVIEESEVNTAGDFLPSAFGDLADQMGLSGNKLEAAQNEFNLVLNEISSLPVAITDTFFNKPNASEAGSGELFSLSVNPSSCTGCSTCAKFGDAITMEEQTEANLSDAKEQFKIWEQLPDTSGETISRLFHDEEYSSLAAMMLSRNYLMSMSGASNSESDNAYKTLLHLVTATTESVIQPRIVEQIKLIDGLVAAISENIHKTLSASLPKENLETLSKALKEAGGRKIPFQDVVSKITADQKGKLVDTVALSRKTDLVDALNNLKWALAKGPTGVGRSRFGMLVVGENSMEWAKQYPFNNFSNPSVINWNGSASDQTFGLFKGQLRYLLDNIKLLRRAALEAKDKYDPSTHDLDIAGLSWNDLTADEKKLVPPILLVAERNDLDNSSWNSLNKLLAEEYPIKVILLDHAIAPTNMSESALNQSFTGVYSAIALKNAYVFQGGMGNQEQLFIGLMEGLGKSCPALFNLYTTKASEYASMNESTPYAALALNSRAFPGLKFDPEDENNFISGAVNLDSNSHSSSDWISYSIDLGDEATLEYKVTWADWAFNQDSWKTEFQAIKSEDTNVALADYISLSTKDRKSKTAVVIRSSINGVKHYAVSNKVVGMTEAVLLNWNTLQELGGLTTEYPDKLKESVTEEVKAAFDKEVANLKKEHEQQLREIEAKQTEALKVQLKEKLVALTNMVKS